MLTDKALSSYYWLLLFLLYAAASCTSKKTKLVALMADAKKGLIQVKKINNKTVAMQLLSIDSHLQKKNSSGNDFYMVKLALRTGEKQSGINMMQYMDFGIKNSFYAVEGIDTMACAVCERIPGISQTEYLYLALFNKPVFKDRYDKDLNIIIADTVAGFGMMVFKIKKETLKEIESLR